MERVIRALAKSKELRRYKVIVGNNRKEVDTERKIKGYLNRTKLWSSQIDDIIFNPSWIVPDRIATGEIASELKKDPQYLSKAGLQRHTRKDGSKTYVQKAGKQNALGRVKFILEGNDGIFLHDTDKRWLFKETIRAFSHGCMRVQKPLELAEWLSVRDQGTPHREIRKALASASEKGIGLKTPVPVHIEYNTVEADEKGNVLFLIDVYYYDRAVMKGELPAVEHEKLEKPE